MIEQKNILKPYKPKMKRRINKIAIIGSGIMGSGIACHFANIGVEVLLLDIVPRELNDKEKKEVQVRFSKSKELEGFFYDNVKLYFSLPFIKCMYSGSTQL